MIASGAYVGGGDAQCAGDLPLDVQIPLEFVCLRRILLDEVPSQAIGPWGMVGEVRKRRVFGLDHGEERSGMIDVAAEKVRQRQDVEDSESGANRVLAASRRVPGKT